MDFKFHLPNLRTLSETMAVLRRIILIPYVPITNNNLLPLKNNLKEHSQDLEKSKNH